MVPKVAVSIGYYPSLGFQGVCTQRHSWNPRVLIQDSWMFSSWLTSSKPPKNRVVQSSSRSFDSEEWESFEALSLALDVLAGQATCYSDANVGCGTLKSVYTCSLAEMNSCKCNWAGWIVWKQLETIRGICDARERCSNWPSPCPLPILSQYYCALFTCSDPLPCSPALPLYSVAAQADTQVFLSP